MTIYAHLHIEGLIESHLLHAQLAKANKIKKPHKTWGLFIIRGISNTENTKDYYTFILPYPITLSILYKSIFLIISQSKGIL